MSISDIQLYLVGTAFAGIGGLLVKDSSHALELLKPLTKFVESKYGLSSISASSRGSAPLLAIVGALLFLQGFQMIMSAYTLDEKAKRNSVPTRFMFGFASYYTCFKTPHGSSLIAVLGALNVFTGFLMGLTVGFGDGNAVDVEIANEAAKQAKVAAIKTK